jgi:uncharacterized protein YeaO (DUF488 family)
VALPARIHSGDRPTYSLDEGLSISVHIVRLGTPRAADEGLRLGTVRRPPRGVPKAEFASRDFYDVWLPALSPSAELVTLALQAAADDDERGWARFVKRFRSEMKEPDASHLLDLLAALSHQSRFSIGCYCADEARCHRSVLRALLQERGADVTPEDAAV